MKKREEIPECFTWDMTNILPSDEAWEALYQKTEQKLPGYEMWKGRLADSGETLLSCLTFDEEVSLMVERLFVYGRQKLDQNTADPKYQDFAARAQTLAYRAAGLSSFIVPEIVSIDKEQLSRFLEETDGLKRYRRTLETIDGKRAHTLSAGMESLLADSMEATQSPSDIFNMFNNADVRFPSVTDREGRVHPVTHGTYLALMKDSDREVRKEAFTSLHGVYSQFSNTLAATFAANVKQAVFYAKARNYPSSRAYYLAQNEIPETVYDNLISAVRGGLPKLHEYVSVRKKALKLDEIHMYDLYVPMVAGYDEKISYEEAKEIVLKGLAPLGEEYCSLLREGFENRWIDVYENEGKRSGAYSWGVYGSHPYVLLNYNGTLDHVFTLAHEMGHSLHSYYSNQNQTYVDAGYKIFVAEVASTCNEALLIRHMLEQTKDRKKRAYLLNHFLESFRTTFFRQTMFAEFEAETHRRAQQNEALTSDRLCDIYHRLNVSYFGPDMTVDHESDYEWARIPHFYTPFYVYQYATGFCAAVAISSRILAGDQAALTGYRHFLKGGNSLPPIELLKLCGVDMSAASPVSEALTVFHELLREFKSI